jgi:hypothetical protein
MKIIRTELYYKIAHFLIGRESQKKGGFRRLVYTEYYFSLSYVRRYQTGRADSYLRDSGRR